MRVAVTLFIILTVFTVQDRPADHQAGAARLPHLAVGTDALVMIPGFPDPSPQDSMVAFLGHVINPTPADTLLQFFLTAKDQDHELARELAGILSAGQCPKDYSRYSPIMQPGWTEQAAVDQDDDFRVAFRIATCRQTRYLTITNDVGDILYDGLVQ